MSARVAFPVLYAALRLHLDKGRQWSVVEHLLLYALCGKPRTAAELSVEGNLPRRLVIEVIIRLIRVGWVELVSVRRQVGFRATAAGRNIVMQDTLPAVTRPVSRWASFAIDCLTGKVFRARDLTLYSKRQLKELETSGSVIVLPTPPEMPVRSADEIIRTLLDDDEDYRGSDPYGARPTTRFAIVTVHGESIEGLSARAPKLLKDQILHAANGAQAALPKASPATAPDPVERLGSGPLEIVFDRRDLILGAEPHRKALEDVLSRSRSLIVLHSTFVSANRFRAVLPLLGDAAHRGARIDILWGKANNPEGSNATAVEVARCREMLTDAILQSRIKLHHFSTGSHAKLVLADDGRGRMMGIVGSCNWLSTGFDSYESSVRISDPLMVAEIAGQLADMSDAPYGHWSELTDNLAGIAANLRRAPRPKGHCIKAALVLGADHVAYMRKARDCAERRIVVASHRLGGSAENSILTPARKAAAVHNVDVTLYYGRPSGPISGVDAAGMTLAARDDGIQIRRIHRPRLHAKFLVWDDDHALITSQNWLSADPPDSNPRGEIGVYLSARGIGREVVERTRAAMLEA